MKKFLIKLLNRSIIKTRLWLILDYIELLLTVVTILVLGFSPGLLTGCIIKETYVEWFTPILFLCGIIFTFLAFRLLAANNKIEAFLNSTIQRIKQSHQDVNNCKFMISCIKKVNRYPLTRYEETELEKFLIKLKVSIKEL